MSYFIIKYSLYDLQELKNMKKGILIIAACVLGIIAFVGALYIVGIVSG
jgi:hypothetical protein